MLEPFVADHDLEAAEAKKRTKQAGGGIELDEALGEPGDDDDEEEWEEKTIQSLFDQSKYVVEGNYGIDAITHCCLEPHGSTLALGRRPIEGPPFDAKRFANRRWICRRLGYHRR